MLATVAHGCGVPQFSPAWIICEKPWFVPIFVSRKAECIAQNTAAVDVPLAVDKIARIDLHSTLWTSGFDGNAAAKK